MHAKRSRNVLVRQSDSALLVPAFWERLKPALVEVKGQGFNPVLHETLRSRERALKLVADGKSKAKGGLSMHCFGVAADVICGDHQWSCKANHCKFFETYGEIIESVGLTWGGRWPTMVDLPHCQAIPLNLQALVRTAKPEDINEMVKTFFESLRQ